MLRLAEELKIGDIGVTKKDIAEAEMGYCYFHGVKYKVMAGADVRKWRQVIVVKLEPYATVTELGYTTPSKPLVTGGFKRWSDLWEGDIGGESVAVIVAYKVPKGWRLNMGGGVISCDVSCLQDVMMTHTPGILGHFRYDVRGDIVFGPLSSTIIDEEETMTYHVFNNDTVKHHFSVSLVGVLEKK